VFAAVVFAVVAVIAIVAFKKLTVYCEIYIHVVQTDTERAALNAGTVGFDRNIYAGNPSLQDLKAYTVKTTAEEQGMMFIDFPHPTLLGSF
jgi:hypothetical protein